MNRSRKLRITATAVVLAALATTGAGTAANARTSPEKLAACGAFFDDFNYSSRTDPNFTNRRWQVRTNAGGPGVGGAIWAASNVTFPTVDGQKSLQLRASTNGTPSGTTHAQVQQRDLRFFEGTYATRFKFSDTPVSGADGDRVNQTFYTISPLDYDWEPTYSELDISEYLPNGGWGETGPVNFLTSWNTYQADPFDGWRISAARRFSHAGWHTLVATVGAGHVKYYIDGALVADHTTDDAGRSVYPRRPMTLNYNQWFIDLEKHTGGTSAYVQSADWVYYAKNEVLSPATATARVNSYRSAGASHADTISC
ncbi:glycoside hydrolase family 16 protein [Kribbella sp. CA-293567]|uniref:glycoside hydrolase family 16 protein n=1 Tax=Kribbella sp. CA-293567 TaxID=3002436 RepID=UPI0022DD5C62|nr:glycoside hydrolase family 16 protein [Kribbella sp. CA-293567]WBQ05407.1 glycoside hydrolase family 16 protein [Kribbella sp. CA-293567]